MTIQLLGTAAAEGIPALGCNCRVCATARERGGKNSFAFRCPHR
jgi:phosphoribosyl 1,2-cyclic phosphate phosphodiesterase